MPRTVIVSAVRAPFANLAGGLPAPERFGCRLGDGTLIDLMTHDGLVSTFDGRHMIEQASFVSSELGVSREDQDAWAYRSHQRAVAAIDEGRFRDELVPVGEVEL